WTPGARGAGGAAPASPGGPSGRCERGLQALAQELCAGQLGGRGSLIAPAHDGVRADEHERALREPAIVQHAERARSRALGLEVLLGELRPIPAGKLERRRWGVGADDAHLRRPSSLISARYPSRSVRWRYVRKRRRRPTSISRPRREW